MFAAKLNVIVGRNTTIGIGLWILDGDWRDDALSPTASPNAQSKGPVDLSWLAGPSAAIDRQGQREQPTCHAPPYQTARRQRLRLARMLEKVSVANLR